MVIPELEQIAAEVVQDFEGDDASGGQPVAWRPDAQHVRDYMREGAPRFALLSEATQKATPPGSRVLEVGAAYGATLLALRAAGYEVAATDVDAGIQAFCRPLLSAGVEVRRWDLHCEDGPYEPESFDVVICAEVLEHLQMSCGAAARKLHTLLKSGGTLLVTTPNLYRAANLVRILRGHNIIEQYPDTPHLVGGIVADDQREHPRELTRRELLEGIRSAGLSVYTAQGFNATNAGLPFLTRGLLRMLPGRLRQYALVGAVKE